MTEQLAAMRPHERWGTSALEQQSHVARTGYEPACGAEPPAVTTKPLATLAASSLRAAVQPSTGRYRPARPEPKAPAPRPLTGSQRPDGKSRNSSTSTQGGSIALGQQSHVALSKEAAKPAYFEGGYIQIPTMELVYLWSSLQSGSVRPYDARTWLAARELAHERTFASRGVVPVYSVSELETLVGGGGGKQIRASLRRLRRAGLMSWSPKAPRFAKSEDSLTPETRPLVSTMAAQMPARRGFFPMPRRVLRLLAGGVKRSVMATVFAHLLRCPHRSGGVWNPVGAVKACWIAETFGISERSAARARSHLVNKLGWLTPVEAQIWRQKLNGGYFAVNLSWSSETPAQTASESKGAVTEPVLSDQNGRNDAVLSELESEQTSPTEISRSDLDGGKPPEHPPTDFFKQTSEERSVTRTPSLLDIKPSDLPSVERVMGLFNQALACPRWKQRGWTPRDSHLERLNWAAAARRAHVRGGTNPCGVFVHLVSKRKWGHVSNEDEDAVRAAFSRWATPVLPAGVEEKREGLAVLRNELTPDGAVVRRIEDTLRERAPLASRAEVDEYLQARAGWGRERIEAARSSFTSWRQELEDTISC